jgi:hypothetical protein
MPATSRGVGNWRRTIAPMIVANTGSSASISANVALGSRAIASWSATYGMTDEQTPTPAPASSRTGCVNAGSAPGRPIGVITSAAITIDAASRSILSRPRFAMRWPSRTYSVNRTQLPNANTNPSG